MAACPRQQIISCVLEIIGVFRKSKNTLLPTLTIVISIFRSRGWQPGLKCVAVEGLIYNCNIQDHYDINSVEMLES